MEKFQLPFYLKLLKLDKIEFDEADCEDTVYYIEAPCTYYKENKIIRPKRILSKNISLID